MTGRNPLVVTGVLGALLFSVCTFARGQQVQTTPDEWFRAKPSELKIVDGEIPTPPSGLDYRQRARRTAMAPRVVLDGPGEAYVGPRVGLATGNFRSVYYYGGNQPKISVMVSNSVVFRVPANTKTTGTIYLPKADWSGMAAVRFELDKKIAQPILPASFQDLRQRFYAHHQNLNGAGVGWFRYQNMQSGKQNYRGWKWDDQSLFGLTTGSRLYSERMRIDEMTTVDDEQLVVKADTITPFAPRKYDWKPLIENLNSKPDPLSKLIPADQHAIFLAGFDKMIQLIEEVKANGAILDIFSSRSDQDVTLPRYERQMCLQLDAAAQALGGTLVKSLAVTGSDLEFEFGTDVAVLFESATPAILVAATVAKQQAVVKAMAKCEVDNGRLGEVQYFGAKTPDRVVSSYVADVNGTVVVTNSIAQLKRIVATSEGDQPSLAELDEYQFYRSRYPANNADETVFFILTADAVRRTLSPQWRIASSRRLRVAAILADATASDMDRLANGSMEITLRKPQWGAPRLKQLHGSNAGYRSPVYGGSRFMTPILELDKERVTETEKKAYDSWQKKRYWYRGVAQPTCVSLSIKKRKVEIEASLRPILSDSRFRNLLEISGPAAIRPNAGDRHRGTMFSITYAVDTKTKNSAFGFLGGFLGPLDWIGDSLSVIVEHDPAWQQLADDWEQDKPVDLSRLPVYVRIEVDSPDGAKKSEQKLISVIKSFALEYVTIEEATHKGIRYTRCIANPKKASIDRISAATLLFGSTGSSFILTFNDGLMKQAIDRDLAAKQAVDDGKPLKPYGKPWLGKSLAARADLRLLETFSGLYFNEYQGTMQARSWGNLTILNEWKKRYPDKDAVKLHASVWSQIVHCPGGGKYVWNDEFQTYESTIYGHPAKPRVGPNLPKQLQSIERIDFGMTFENDGLNAKAVFDRNAY